MMKKKRFDYGKLKGKIIEIYGSQSKFCKENRINEPTFSQKITGRYYFKQDEILEISRALDITDHIGEYFFTLAV